MSCPPGTILNPRTYRCVRATGKLAQELARAGNVGEGEVAAAAVYTGPVRTRVTRRYRPNTSMAAVFGAAAAPRAAVAEQQVPQPVNTTRRVSRAPCPSGSIVNPSTGRCIKVGGRVHRDLFPPTAPEVPRIEAAPRRATSEEPIAIPAGNTAVAPLGSRSAALAWATGNCRNRTDPLTGRSFSTADDAYLSSVVRLHNNTCTAAPALHTKVATAHKAGKIATLPDSTDPLTLPDFKVLRDAMRRTNPGYKLPPRRHQPPPPEWQLYVAQDERSGPEFASVAYVDITKARRTIYGIEYPADAIRVDLGFIPTETPAGAICSAGMVVDLLERLDKEHRLVVPVAGGWKPVHGFPFTKAHWSRDRAARFSRLCKDLARALTLPI
jgi:hypothetical protein